MHEIADNDETSRCVIAQQLQQTIRRRFHSPHRHEPTGRALAELVAKMQVGDREPFLAFVKEREPAIEHEIWRDERLMWRERLHAGARKLWVASRGFNRY